MERTSLINGAEQGAQCDLHGLLSDEPVYCITCCDLVSYSRSAGCGITVSKMAKERKTRSKKTRIIFGVCLVVCMGVALAVGLILHFQGGGAPLSSRTKSKTDAVVTKADNRTDAIVDCNPEGGANQEDCEKRGCEWVSRSDKTLPSCVFPRGYGYRMVGETQTTPTGLRVELERTVDQEYLTGSPAVHQLYLDIEFHTPARLRIRLRPKNGTRWEIPDSILNIPTPNPGAEESSRLYNVTVVKEPTFGVIVQRKSSGATVFDSSLPGLVYSDQFLQMSTRLSTDYIYGFGEHNHRRLRHDMNWRTWSIFTRDVGPVDAWNLYGAHPTYMNVEDDGSANMVFFKNSNAMEVVLQPNPHPAITFRTIGGVLDFYVFLGESPKDAVSQYTEAIGRPVMPPYWTLGFHLCRWGYRNISELEMVIDRNREAGIPYDGQWADIEYMYDKYVFSYDRRTYTGLPELVQNLHDHHQKFVIIIDPGIGSNRTIINAVKNNSPGYDMFDDGVAEDIFVKNPNNSGPIIAKVWPGETAFPDFSNPRTEAWWLKWCKYFRDTEGVKYDSLWIDMNEPASFVPGSVDGCEKNKWNYPPYTPNILGRGNDGRMYDKTLCMDSKHHLGPHYDLHSLYAHTQAIQTYNTLKQIFPGKRPFTMTRSSFAGTGKYATKWMGDNQANWDNMKWSIISVIEFGFFGFALNGADICGFWYEAHYEMCIRWHQLGAFYPFARNHNGRGDPGEYFKHQDPGAWDDSFIWMTKGVLYTRYKLLPYFYTLLHLAHAQGETFMRSLMFEFPKDKVAREVQEQFMLGEALLISPVLNPNQTIVKAYFPNARFFNYFGGEEVKGRETHVELYTPLIKYNLHVRGGRVVPWQVPATTTYMSRQNEFGAIIALCDDGLSNGNLFWDDGESLNTYEDGNYLHVKFEMKKSGMLDIYPVVNGSTPDPPPLTTLDLYGFRAVPTTIMVDGVELGPVQIRPVSKIIHLLNLNLNLRTPHNVTWTQY